MSDFFFLHSKNKNLYNLNISSSYYEHTHSYEYAGCSWFYQGWRGIKYNEYTNDIFVWGNVKQYGL